MKQKISMITKSLVPSAAFHAVYRGMCKKINKLHPSIQNSLQEFHSGRAVYVNSEKKVLINLVVYTNLQFLNRLYIFWMMLIIFYTHSICASSVLKEPTKPLPTEKKAPAFSRVNRATAVKAARLRELPKAGSLQIPVRAYLAQIGSLEQNFSAAEGELQKGNIAYVQRLRDDLIQAQKFFAEALEQLSTSDKKKIEQEFTSFVYSSVEEWKTYQKQRLIDASSRLKRLEEQAALLRSEERARVPEEQAPAKRAKTVRFEEPVDLQAQLQECRRFYDKLDQQHKELVRRFVQSVAMCTSEKKAFDELRRQLDKLIQGREELNDLYARDRAQFMQEITRLQQQPASVPEGVLQELAELRGKVAQLEEIRTQERKHWLQQIKQLEQLNSQAVAQLEETENKARTCGIELSAIKSQRDEYKNALDDIFGHIVYGVPYEKLEDAMLRKVSETDPERVSDLMIANEAGTQLFYLQAVNLISVPEIQKKINAKKDEMKADLEKAARQATQLPPKKKKKIKAEPVKK